VVVIAILGEFIDTDPTLTSQIYFAKKRGNNAGPKTCYLRSYCHNCFLWQYKHNVRQSLGKVHFLQYLPLRLHLVG